MQSCVGDLGSLKVDSEEPSNALKVGESQAWLLLALWVARRSGRDGDAALSAELALFVAAIDDQQLQLAFAEFEQRLGGYASDSWETARSRRLNQAARRAAP